MTRFLVVGREQATPTGRDKTSLLLVTRDEPGILYRVLGAFAERGLNMTQDREPPVAPPALGVRLLRRHRRPRTRRSRSRPRWPTCASRARRSRCWARTRAPRCPGAPPRRAVIANGRRRRQAAERAADSRRPVRNFLNAVAEFATAPPLKGRPRAADDPMKQMGRAGPRRRQRSRNRRRGDRGRPLDGIRHRRRARPRPTPSRASARGRFDSLRRRPRPARRARARR